MLFVKVLLVFFALTGCAEVVSDLPLVRGAAAPPAQAPAQLSDAARLGPPNPHGLGARRVDRAAADTAVATRN
ncbi:MAG TPA: hypothetical protein VNW92_06115 [Polyangiaceae bacterium]|jgi:hypothetical protein|nr:hypothetical protein [Polyangiaceae bacterium]